jgi:hypothetical protein
LWIFAAPAHGSFWPKADILIAWLEKVLERLATTDKAALVCEKAPEGRRKAKCESRQALGRREGDFEGSGARGRDVEARLHFARKARLHDD